MEQWVNYLTVFCAIALYDVVWAQYTLGIAEGSRVKASLWAGAIPIFMAVMTRAYVEDAWTIVPAALGGALGTWVSMTYNRQLSLRGS